MAEKKPLKHKSLPQTSKADTPARKVDSTTRKTGAPASRPKAVGGAKPVAKPAARPAAKPAVKSSKTTKAVKTQPAAGDEKVKKQTPKSDKVVPVKKSKPAVEVKRVKNAVEPETKSHVKSASAKSKSASAPVGTTGRRSRESKAAPAPDVTAARKPKARVDTAEAPVHAAEMKSGNGMAHPRASAPAKAAPAKAAPAKAAPAKAAPAKAPKTRTASSAGREEGESSERRKKRKYTRRVAPVPAPVVAPKYQGRVATPASRKADAKADSRPSQKNVVQYSKEILEFFRSVIVEKIKEANEELVSIEERLLDSSSGEFNDDDSTYSLHMADQGTDAMEREKAFLFAQRERKFISHLSDALQRISSGNFGICINCGDLIDKGRLEAVPHARMCVNCKNKSKQSE